MAVSLARGADRGAPLASAASPGAKLLAQGIGKHYGTTVALEPTDFQLSTGEFVTVLGPSGSGKTTLLQVICGLVVPTSGRLFIDGRDETHTPVHRRRMGVVFQTYALFPHMTVQENVAFSLDVRRVRGAELARRVAGALDMVGLGALRDRFPRELSGGQQQRVALARCFVYEPSLILMDEPLGALDRKLRETMQIEIKRLHRQTGATILFVTHDQEEALALSDRICLMNHARLEQSGTPQAIYERPRQRLRRRVHRHQQRAARHSGRGRRGVDDRRRPGDAPVRGTPWAAGALVIRPEHMQLPRPARPRLSGTVSRDRLCRRGDPCSGGAPVRHGADHAARPGPAAPCLRRPGRSDLGRRACLPPARLNPARSEPMTISPPHRDQDRGPRPRRTPGLDGARLRGRADHHRRCRRRPGGGHPQSVL